MPYITPTTTHACPRCGLESPCSAGSWPDRHPVAAVTLSVFALAAVCAYPWLLGCLVVGALAYVAHREHRRRAALAARADYEHRALMAQSPWAPGLHPVRPRRPAPWHVVSLLPTDPIPYPKERSP